MHAKRKKRTSTPAKTTTTGKITAAVRGMLVAAAIFAFETLECFISHISAKMLFSASIAFSNVL